MKINFVISFMMNCYFLKLYKYPITNVNFPMNACTEIATQQAVASCDNIIHSSAYSNIYTYLSGIKRQFPCRMECKAGNRPLLRNYFLRAEAHKWLPYLQGWPKGGPRVAQGWPNGGVK